MNNTKSFKWLLCLFIVHTPLLSQAQNKQPGIQWITDLSWQQVKQKAELDNKYIFIDCYTTWCAPCKMMDASVYINDSVGDYFNDKFISVRVQMDKTDKDNEHVKKWYADADSIGKIFHVEGFPCYIFLSPKGKIVHKAMGFRPVPEFIGIAKAAVVPGKVYDDRYAQYDQFVNRYRTGEKNYALYPKMIPIALAENDTSIALPLMRELSTYMQDLPKGDRYTKERMEMWANIEFLPSMSRVFQFFYKDGKIIDRVVGINGFSRNVVDRIIQREICIPFLEKEARGVAMTGSYLTGRALKTDSAEAAWSALQSKVKEKFGKEWSRNAVLTARVEWYKRHFNWEQFVKYSLIQLMEYPPDFKDGNTGIVINDVSWNAFLYSTDKKVLGECIPLMRKTVLRYPTTFEFVDTYANLLYKTGRTKEAIKWQQKAVDMAPNQKLYQMALDNMKQGKPTYGAIWNKRN